jgi:hypothetical protein
MQMKVVSMQKELDIVRATLTSCCMGIDGVVTPTHFHRVNHLSKIFGLKSSFVEHLDVLRDLQEIAELPKSYWVPVQSRSIHLGSLWMILSSYPTEQLPKDINPQRSTGFARSADSPLAGYPTQDLTAWLGSQETLTRWLGSEIELAKKNLRDTAYAVEDVEFYTPWIKGRGDKGAYQNWRKMSSLGADEKGLLMLGRYKGDFFWGTFDSERLFESSRVFNRNQLIKTQIAIEQFFGLKGREVKFASNGNRFSITSRLKLPEQLLKLFLALGDKNMNSPEDSYSFSDTYLDCVNSQLSVFNIYHS